MTEKIQGAIDCVLNSNYWLPTLKTGEVYQRYEDDSPLGTLSVIIGGDGDCHIAVIQERDPKECRLSMRYRMPMTGGGQSPRVRNALLVLAEAIRLDNIDHPQHR